MNDITKRKPGRPRTRKNPTQRILIRATDEEVDIIYELDTRQRADILLRASTSLDRALLKAATKAGYARTRARYYKIEENTLTFENVRTLMENSSGYCPVCKEYMGVEYLSLDHIVPMAKGGANSFDNARLICLRCNQRKSDKTDE